MNFIYCWLCIKAMKFHIKTLEKYKQELWAARWQLRLYKFRREIEELYG